MSRSLIQVEYVRCNKNKGSHPGALVLDSLSTHLSFSSVPSQNRYIYNHPDIQYWRVLINAGLPLVARTSFNSYRIPLSMEEQLRQGLPGNSIGKFVVVFRITQVSKRMWRSQDPETEWVHPKYAQALASLENLEIQKGSINSRDQVHKLSNMQQKIVREIARGTIAEWVAHEREVIRRQREAKLDSSRATELTERDIANLSKPQVDATMSDACEVLRWITGK